MAALQAGSAVSKRRIDLRLHADFMARDLVGPPAGVLGPGGGEPLGGLEPGGLAGTAGGAGGEFAFVALEILIDAVQFPAQIVFLPGADGCQVVGEVGLERGAQKGYPALWVGRWPGDVLRRRVGLGEADRLGQELVRFAVRQREGQAAQRPMLVDGLNFATDQGHQ